MALPRLDQSRESWALFPFTIQLLLCSTGVTIYEAIYRNHANALAAAVAIGRGLAPQCGDHGNHPQRPQKQQPSLIPPSEKGERKPNPTVVLYVKRPL